MFNLSKIMREAHARAKADREWERANSPTRMALPYRYYLGLQMRSGFAEARIALTGMAQVSSYARDVQGTLRSAF